MKRYGQIWPRIIAFENLLEAARKAQRCKRFRDNILSFNANLEDNLLQLQSEIQIVRLLQNVDFLTFFSC